MRTVWRWALIALALAGLTPGQPASPCSRQFEQAEAARLAGHLKEAIPLYEQALRCDPRRADGWWGLGSLLYEMDRYAEAAEAFRRVTLLAPKKGDAFAMLGLCEALLGRRQQALRHLGQGRRLGLRNDAAFARVVWYHEAMLLLEQGAFGQAQERFEALARDGVPAREIALPLGMATLGIVPPSEPAARAALRPAAEAAGQAQYFSARKETDKAREFWQVFLRDHGSFRNAHFAYGRFLLSIYEDDAAVKEFQAELARDPRHVLACLGIAGTRAGQDPEFALPYAEKAVRLAPHLGEAHFLLGMILLNLGNTGPALKELEEARRLSPREARVYFQLARAYARAGRTREAEAARRMFQQLGGAGPEPARPAREEKEP